VEKCQETWQHKRKQVFVIGLEGYCAAMVTFSGDSISASSNGDFASLFGQSLPFLGNKRETRVPFSDKRVQGKYLVTTTNFCDFIHT
jgi:hypothetical protein